MISPDPSRGDVWDLNFESAAGHDAAGSRSALIVSEDLFNQGPAGLLVVVPITRAQRKVRWHVPVAAPDGGLTAASFIECENVRSVSKERLKRRRGRVSPPVLQQVEDRLRILLGL